jgi:hypothetical protein
MHFLLVHIHVSVNKKWQSNSLLPLLASENPRSVRYVRASRQRHVSRANVLHVLIFIYFSLNLQEYISLSSSSSFIVTVLFIFIFIQFSFSDAYYCCSYHVPNIQYLKLNRNHNHIVSKTYSWLASWTTFV